MNQQSSTSAVEDFISFRDHQVWYRIIQPSQEELGKLPLLCLHGGSGIPHDYLEPLEALAYTGRRVTAALENLQQAIRLDTKLRAQAKTDSDFDNIRQNHQFQTLVGE